VRYFQSDGRTLASGGGKPYSKTVGCQYRAMPKDVGRINRLNGVAYSPNGQTVAGNFEILRGYGMLPLGNA